MLSVSVGPCEKLRDVVSGWSANRKCVLSSALFKRVEVPLALK
jgi:hypothetical protein